jgi:hypothetical protein
MKLSFANLQHAYARLAPRERSFVLAGLGTTILLVLFFVVQGMQASKTRLREGIAAKHRQIVQVQALRAQYLELRRQTDEMTAKTADRSPSGLYATLEGLVTKTVAREKIRSMNPSSKPIGDRYVEDSVNVELLGITLQQAVSLLYEIDQQTTPIHVSALKMTKRVSDPYQFDVVFTVSSVKANA